MYMKKIIYEHQNAITRCESPNSKPIKRSAYEIGQLSKCLNVQLFCFLQMLHIKHNKTKFQTSINDRHPTMNQKMIPCLSTTSTRATPINNNMVLSPQIITSKCLHPSRRPNKKKNGNLPGAFTPQIPFHRKVLEEGPFKVL